MKMNRRGEGQRKEECPEGVQRRRGERVTEEKLESDGWKARQNLKYAYARRTGGIESWTEKVMKDTLEKVIKSFPPSRRKEVVKETRLGRRVYYSPEVIERVFEELDNSKHNPKNKR